MATYKLTNSIDGAPRISFNVKHRLALSDLATYITAELNTDISEDLRDDRLNDELVPNFLAIKRTLPNKSTAMRIVKNHLMNDGEERAHYFVGDGGWNAVATAVESRLLTLWDGNTLASLRKHLPTFDVLTVPPIKNRA